MEVTKKENLGYLYGEYKIYTESIPKKKKDRDGFKYEEKYLTIGKGKNEHQVYLWREIGTDDWYNSNNDLANIRLKKKKITKNFVIYD